MDHPKTFTDTKGRSWNMEIGWPAFLRVKNKCGLDLNSLIPHKGDKDQEHESKIQKFLNLIHSSTDFPPVLTAILETQMKAAGVTDADFMDGFETGESIEAAMLAFRQGLTDFIRDPLQKMIFTKAMQGVEKAMGAAVKTGSDHMDEATEKVIGTMRQRMSQELDSRLKKLSTDFQESSASTPTPAKA
jgi:hypothetical protein